MMPAGAMETVAVGDGNQLEAQQRRAIPEYLQRNYWWAYVHPRAVRFFERQWLVNLILCGNFALLRDAALGELGSVIQGRILQVACVYGDFSAMLAERLGPGSTLDVVDVLPIQLQNLRRKLTAAMPVTLYHRDSTALGFDAGSYDQVIIFFLLHEQPLAVRKKTLAEALRVVKPGGKLVILDYHRPSYMNPLRYLLWPLLRALEPSALDLWNHEIDEWLPVEAMAGRLRKLTFCGGLYQKLVIRV